MMISPHLTLAHTLTPIVQHAIKDGVFKFWWLRVGGVNLHML